MKPVWISHRGYCQGATENTAESFRAALELGFTHLETDLRVTADNHLVLSHDPALGRISDSTLGIAESTREQLEQVTLNGGESLLFFDHFLSEFAAYHWIFDIKPEGGQRTLALLLDWWSKPQWVGFFARRVRFLLWHPPQQNYLLQRRPDAVCMAPLGQCRRAALACLSGLPRLSGIKPGVSYALPPRLGGIKLMRASVLERYRRRGGRVLAYLPKCDAEARLALAAGADEILTDHRILSLDGEP